MTKLCIIGYLITYGYIFLLILGIGLITKNLKNKNISRKIIHILLFAVWIFIDVFFKNTIHQIIIPVSFLIINSISYKFKIFKAIEREEDNHLGTIYFAISITIMTTIAYFIPNIFVYSGISVFCLCFGDGFAALFGECFGKKKIYNKKTYFGFLSCILFTTLSLVIFKFYRLPEMSLMLIILISFLIGILELVDFGLDNFTITLIPFGLFTLIGINGNLEAIIALVISIITFVFVFLSKSISFYGSLFAMIIVFCFSYFGGYLAVAYLLICYFISFLIGLVKKNYLGTKKGRNFLQIFVNGFIGLLLCILAYYINIRFLLISFISIAGALVDSISSDIGIFSKKEPYDLIRRKRVARGLSGGISFLGTATSIISSVFLGLLMVYFLKIKIIMLPLYSLLILSDTIIDSIIGSIIQVKYKCSKCGIITERKEHCGTKTRYYCGIKIVDNNLVNFISNACVVLLSYLVIM